MNKLNVILTEMKVQTLMKVFFNFQYFDTEHLSQMKMLGTELKLEHLTLAPNPE